MKYMPQQYARQPGFDEPLGDRLQRAASQFKIMGFDTLPIGPNKKPMCGWSEDKLPPYRHRYARLGSKGAKGLAIQTGSKSGSYLGASVGSLVVRDFDGPEGVAAYQEWAERHPDLATTLPTADTPGRGGGIQVYAWAKDRVKTQTLAYGELRGDGAYCIAPPSIHPNGGSYVWRISPFEKFYFPITGTPLPMVAPEDFGVPEERPEPEKAFSPLPGGEHHSRTMDYCDSLINGMGHTLMGLDEFVDWCMSSTLPRREGERNHRIFHLAQRIRLRFPRETPQQDLLPIVQRWHALALPVIRTKDFETTWRDFDRAWGNVSRNFGRPRFRPGFCLRVRDLAIAEPVSIGRFDSSIGKVASILRAAWNEAGESAFYFSERVISDLTGIPQCTVNRHIHDLIASKHVIRNFTGRWADRQASVYTWNGGIS